MSARIVSGKALIGHDLETPDGTELGEVRDVIIDVSEGALSYVVLARGGILGMGEKLFAVPWRFLDVTSDGSMLLDVDPDLFDDAVGFDPDHWPRFDDDHWQRHLDAHYAADAPEDRASDEAPDHDEGRFPSTGTG